jgi:hypothetical protein
MEPTITRESNLVLGRRDGLSRFRPKRRLHTVACFAVVRSATSSTVVPGYFQRSFASLRRPLAELAPSQGLSSRKALRPHARIVSR